MSIYGDYGNILAMSYRLKKYGFNVIYQKIGIKQELPEETDFYFLGGGQDKEQLIIFKDLLQKKEKLIQDIEEGSSLLAICGGYQLLGKKFITGEGEEVTGIGLFDVETKAPNSNVKTRCTGNLIIESGLAEIAKIKLIGFENHSGQTRFVSKERCHPLGKVLHGFGNNINKKYEGCVYKNAIGTYLHGSCLPKNPELADWLIFKRLERKVRQEKMLKEDFLRAKKIKIDDKIALLNKQQLIQRFLEESNN
jgi:CobQ-like glutamine amidotransferase family enzyme